MAVSCEKVLQQSNNIILNTGFCYFSSEKLKYVHKSYILNVSTLKTSILNAKYAM